MKNTLTRLAAGIAAILGAVSCAPLAPPAERAPEWVHGLMMEDDEPQWEQILHTETIAEAELPVGQAADTAAASLEAEPSEELKLSEKAEPLEKSEPSEQEVSLPEPEVSQCRPEVFAEFSEHDYRRLEKQLSRWPHNIENTLPVPHSNHAAKTFRVLLPTEGDVLAKLDDLKRQGFSGTLVDGEISTGVHPDRSSAQVQIARLGLAGFGGSRVQAELGGIRIEPPRIKILFLPQTDQDIEAIRKISGAAENWSVKRCE
ncbi:hypothetical protein [Neisseria animalis]|uniref:SPOR domain-containing protein n=1 Tax=Neisseria animalis TaxID=492 RepID=A0A5P3MRR6_NEIAN|nr:hypothetical protein [Neisseria animalis]QEY24274.1 hypothetical protein D0T90_07055 [Neisseria animalis]ROW32320.1 hypothetical protein CGZ60_05640 [Neisseria animalis]VEE06671.1 Periplasmic protein [Neisseria animalis]